MCPAICLVGLVSRLEVVGKGWIFFWILEALRRPGGFSRWYGEPKILSCSWPLHAAVVVAAPVSVHEVKCLVLGCFPLPVHVLLCLNFASGKSPLFPPLFGGFGCVLSIRPWQKGGAFDRSDVAILLILPCPSSFLALVPVRFFLQCAYGVMFCRIALESSGFFF